MYNRIIINNRILDTIMRFKNFKNDSRNFIGFISHDTNTIFNRHRRPICKVRYLDLQTNSIIKLRDHIHKNSLCMFCMYNGIWSRILYSSLYDLRIPYLQGCLVMFYCRGSYCIVMWCSYAAIATILLFVKEQLSSVVGYVPRKISTLWNIT